MFITETEYINPLNAELSPICHLLPFLAHHIFHVSRKRVKVEWKTGYLAHRSTRSTDRGTMAPGLHAKQADTSTQIQLF